MTDSVIPFLIFLLILTPPFLVRFWKAIRRADVGRRALFCWVATSTVTAFSLVMLIDRVTRPADIIDGYFGRTTPLDSEAAIAGPVNPTAISECSVAAPADYLSYEKRADVKLPERLSDASFRLRSTSGIEVLVRIEPENTGWVEDWGSPNATRHDGSFEWVDVEALVAARGGHFAGDADVDRARQYHHLCAALAGDTRWKIGLHPDFVGTVVGPPSDPFVSPIVMNFKTAPVTSLTIGLGGLTGLALFVGFAVATRRLRHAQQERRLAGASTPGASSATSRDQQHSSLPAIP